MRALFAILEVRQHFSVPLARDALLTQRGWYQSEWLLRAVLLVGCGLRLHWYLFDRSLSWDEAALALNVLHKPGPALFGSLDDDQAAPVGFLLAVKVVTSMFGASERMLRLVPFVSSIGALLLFSVAAKKFGSKNAVPLALAFFAVSRSQLNWSSEFKQYMTDVALTLVVLLAGVWVSERRLDARRALGMALLGAIALWCSHPVVFVLAGVGAVLAYDSVQQRDWLRVRRLAVVGVCWSASFAFHYTVSLRQTMQNNVLMSFWDDKFLSFTEIERSLRLLGAVFVIPLDFAVRHPWPLFLVFALGCATLLARSVTRFLFLIVPLVCLVVASLAHVYPFYHRLILFTAPLWLLPTAEGIVALASRARGPLRPAGITIAAILIGLLGAASLAEAWRGPADVQGVRPLLAYLGQHAEAGDTIYVREFIPEYKYYRAALGLDDRPFVAGQRLDPLWERREDETLDALRGRPRVWAISDFWQVPARLDAIGTCLQSIPGPAAVLYLYDLSVPPRDTSDCEKRRPDAP